MASISLPKFKNPPVVETVLGVQFKAISEFRNAHLGAYWKQLGSDWPTVVDASSLPLQFERFEESSGWGDKRLRLTFGDNFDARIQIKNAVGNRMIQLQNNRFHYNWLGEGGGKYPQYSEIRPEFDRKLESFKKFLAEESLGSIEPDQWEVTYVNHIPRGSVWETPEDWCTLLRFPGVSPGALESVNLESLDANWRYEIQPKQGRLHVRLQRGLTKEKEPQDILVITLTARGPVAQADKDGLSVEQGLDLGHKTIVNAFKEFTSEKAHEHWEYIQEDQHDACSNG